MFLRAGAPVYRRSLVQLALGIFGFEGENFRQQRLADHQEKKKEVLGVKNHQTIVGCVMGFGVN